VFSLLVFKQEQVYHIANPKGTTMNRKSEIFGYIVRHIKERKVSPTVREIAEAVGMSVSNTHRYLNILRDDGAIDWGDRLSRTIVVRGEQ
jgi:SOS-response transcriptional repressor LexA